MGLVLDSSVVIAAERKRFNMKAFIEAEAPMESLFLSAITASELLYGVHRAAPNFRRNRERFVEAILAETPALSFDIACARHHARLWANLASVGNLIGPHEMLIAATCLTYGHRLATLNEKEFQRVEGLALARTGPYAGNAR